MIHLKRELKKHVVKILLGVFVFTLLVLLLGEINDWFFTTAPANLKAFFDSFGVYSLLVFLAIYVVANLFLLPSWIFVFTAGMVFGFYWGVVVSLLIEVISGTINFVLGRKIGKPFFRKKKQGKIKFYRRYIKKHGFGLVFLLRYLGVYFDLVSYAAGAAKIKYKKYIAATFFGFIPYLLIYSYAGANLMKVQSSSFVYSILIFKIILFALFFVGYWLLRNRIKR